MTLLEHALYLVTNRQNSIDCDKTCWQQIDQNKLCVAISLLIEFLPIIARPLISLQPGLKYGKVSHTGTVFRGKQTV